jgi:O-antigen ligase
MPEGGAETGAETSRALSVLIGAATLALLAAYVVFGGGANSAAATALFSTLLAAALGLAFMVSGRARRRRAVAGSALMLLAAGVFVAVAVAGALSPLGPAALDGPPQDTGPVSISPSRSWEGLAALVGPLSAFFLGALAVANAADRERLGRSLVIFMAACAAYALWHTFTGRETAWNRLTAGLGSPNSAATFFMVLALTGLAYARRAARGRTERRPVRVPVRLESAAPLLRAPLALGVLMIVLACLFLTASRAGLVAAAAGLIVYLVMAWARRGRATGFAGAVLVVLAVLLAAGGDWVLRRFDALEDAVSTRAVLVETHWRAFLEAPVWGRGLNSFHEINALAASPENWEALGQVGSAHNIYVQALEETGLVGFALWIVMAGAPLVRLLSRTGPGRPGAEWASATFAATVAALVHGWVDFGLQTPVVGTLVCFLVGAYSRGEADTRKP